MDAVKVLMLGLVVSVWALIYFIWREVDIYIIEQDGEDPPQNLFEIIERRKAMQILPLPDRLGYREDRGNRRLHRQGGML